MRLIRRLPDTNGAPKLRGLKTRGEAMRCSPKVQTAAGIIALVLFGLPAAAETLSDETEVFACDFGSEMELIMFYRRQSGDYGVYPSSTENQTVLGRDGRFLIFTDDLEYVAIFDHGQFISIGPIEMNTGKCANVTRQLQWFLNAPGVP